MANGADQKGQPRLPKSDRRGLTALFWSNIRPYGSFDLDMDRRLDFDLAAAGAAS